MSFKPGALVRIKRNLKFVRLVDLQTADWYNFTEDQIGLYLNWQASQHNGAIQLGLVLIGEKKYYVDEADIELIPSKE